MRRLVLLLGAVGVLGCGAGQKRTNEFMDTIRQYNDGIRWNDAPTAAAVIPLPEREDFLAERAEYEDDLRIGDYEILRVRWGSGRRRAEIDVRYTWHLDSRGLVRKSITRQLWRRFGKAWLMVEESMVRGEPMPGVRQPIDPEKEVSEDESSSPRAGL